MDSMNFDRKSRDNLVSKKFFLDDTMFKLMWKKGMHLYDYIDSPEQMDET